MNDLMNPIVVIISQCVCVCMLCVICVSHSVMSDSLRPHGLVACQVPLFMEFSRQEYWIQIITLYTSNVCSVAKSCPSLCDIMDCSPPGFSVHGILQARILEWVAISFSRRSSWPRDQTHVSCIGRQILYHWATREALVHLKYTHFYRKKIWRIKKKEMGGDGSSWDSVKANLITKKGEMWRGIRNVNVSQISLCIKFIFLIS